MKSRKNDLFRSIDLQKKKQTKMNDKILKQMYEISEIQEILKHREFIRLSDFPHHGEESRLVHAVKVAEYVFIMSFLRNLDVISATRGALLHDFYFYENHTKKKKIHLKEHPQIALDNALKYFTLNPIERDAIVNHMWPITASRPKFKESRLISMVDKMVSFAELRQKDGKNKRRISL